MCVYACAQRGNTVELQQKQHIPAATGGRRRCGSAAVGAAGRQRHAAAAAAATDEGRAAGAAANADATEATLRESAAERLPPLHSYCCTSFVESRSAGAATAAAALPAAIDAAG